MKTSKKDTDNKIMAILYSENYLFLLLKTNPKTMKVNHWFVVTGSLKENETFEEAVKREVKEETNLFIQKITETDLEFNYEWPKNSGKIKHEKVFLVQVKQSIPKLTRWEHVDWKWVSSRDFLKEIHWETPDKVDLKQVLSKISIKY